MKKNFSDNELAYIIDQSLILQCACPAQVSKLILEIRELYNYQINCANDTSNEEQVHMNIASASETSHIKLEACLLEILKIEKWDMKTLKMPNYLKNQKL